MKSPFLVNKARRIFMRMGYTEAQFNQVMACVRKHGHAKDMVHRPTFKAAMFLALGVKPQVGALFERFYTADKTRLPTNRRHFDALNEIEQSVYTDEVSKAIHSAARRTGTQYLGTAVNRLERMKRFNKV